MHGLRFETLILAIITSLFWAGCRSSTGELENLPSRDFVARRDATQASFGSSTKNAVRLSLSLDNTRIVLNQPIIATFEAINVSNESVKLSLGADYKENFSFQLTKPNLTRVALPRLSRDGVAAIGDILIKPGEKYSLRLILNEWANFDQPGPYTVDGKIIEKIDTNSEKSILGGSDFSLRFEVGPEDKEYLDSICKRLFESFENANSYSGAAEVALALTYVNDAVSIPYLKKALFSNRLTETLIINSLRERKDARSVEILIASIKERPGTEMAEYAISALRWIEFNSSDQQLKKRIRAANLGGEYPLPILD